MEHKTATSMKEESYITVTGAAKILNCSGEFVRTLERSGLLPALRTESGIRLFSRECVESFGRERARQKKARRKKARRKSGVDRPKKQ